MEEITDIAAFRAAVESDALILITDNANPTRLHSASCAWVQPTYFEEKVIHGRGANGRYYRVASVERALAEPGPHLIEALL